MKTQLILLVLITASLLSNAQDKKQVYAAYLDDAKIFSYDSVYKKKIDKVAITSLRKDSLEFDSSYLRDYLEGKIERNKTYIKYVQPNNAAALDWLDVWPRDLGKLIAKDRELGEMLSALDSAIRIGSKIPSFAAQDKRFIIFNSYDLIYKIGWKEFYKKQRRSYGLVEISDVVFSNLGNRAAFYIETRRGELNGIGSVVFMKKLSSRWVIDSYLQFWIS